MDECSWVSNAGKLVGNQLGLAKFQRRFLKWWYPKSSRLSILSLGYLGYPHFRQYIFTTWIPYVDLGTSKWLRTAPKMTIDLKQWIVHPNPILQNHDLGNLLWLRTSPQMVTQLQVMASLWASVRCWVSPTPRCRRAKDREPKLHSNSLIHHAYIYIYIIWYDLGLVIINQLLRTRFFQLKICGGVAG